MINRKLNIFHIFRRSSYRYYCIAREGRMLQGLINKKKSGSGAYNPKVSDKNTYAANVLRSVATRRNAVLNKIFMDHVSDLTSTEIYSEEFEKYGISITECKITPNLKLLFVYWIHTKEIDEAEVNELLSNFAKHLSSELTTFSVINKRPMVRVVKDIDYMREQRISSLLDTISLINEQEIGKNNAVKNKSNAISIQNNILGLDYCKILKNILRAKTASEGNIAHEIPNGKIMGESNFDKKILSKKIMQGKYKVQNLREINYMPEDHLSHDDDDDDNDDNDDYENAIEESDIYNNNNNDYSTEEDTCPENVQDKDENR